MRTPKHPLSSDSPFAGLEALEERQLMSAVTFPSAAGLVFQTGGPSALVGFGDWYTSTVNSPNASDFSNSTDRAHYLFVQVTQAMLDASPTGKVTITVNDAESATDPANPLDQDEPRGTSDPTRYRLLDATRTTVVDPGAVLPSGTTDGTSISFDVNVVGGYFVESLTGASVVYNPGEAGYDTLDDLNDDDNAYSLTVSEEGGLIGQYQASLQQDVVASRSLYFLVSPGTPELFLRNFDLDNGASAVNYVKPDGTVIEGTVSGATLWNGTAASGGVEGTLNDGGDVITGLTDADAGVWRVDIEGLGINNQLVFEANTGNSLANAQRIIFVDEIPQAAGAFTLASDGTESTPTGTPVDHVITLRNDFPGNDIFELTLSNTHPQFKVELLGPGVNPGDPPVLLTDTTGNALVDTGVVASLETIDLILRVTPLAGTHAADTTTLTVDSLLDLRLNTTAAQTQSITRTTLRQNAGPQVTAPGDMPIATNTPLVFSTANGNAIVITDLDAAGDAVDVTVSVAHGTFSLATVNAITFTQGDGTQDTTMTFRGSLADLNTALEGATFTPNAGFSGTATLRVEASDRGNNGAESVTRINTQAELGTGASNHTVVTDAAASGGQALELTGAAAPSNPPANGHVTFTLTTEQEGLHRVWLSARGATASSDALWLKLDSANLSASKNITRGDGWVRVGGLHHAAAPSTLTWTRANNADGASLSNTQADAFPVDFYLAPGTHTLRVATADADVIIDQLTLTNTADAPNATGIDLRNARYSAALLDVVVGGTQQAPAVGNDTYSTPEDTPLTLDAASGVLHNDSDPDSPNITAAIVSNPTHGTLSFNTDGSFVYTPNAHFNGTDTFTYRASDGTYTSPLATVTLTVTPVNDGPVLLGPSGVLLPENNPNVTFSFANGNSLNLSDIDVAESGANTVLELSLSANSGTFTLGTFQNISFTTGNGFNSSATTLRGTAQAINTALQGLTYTPASGFSGTDTLTLTANDLGNTGSGGPQTITKTIALAITHSNAGPVHTLPAPQSTDFQTPVVMSIANGNAIQVTDPDIPTNGLVRVRISVSHGTFTLAQTTGLTLSVGDGANDQSMVFTGTLTDTNDALNGLTYTPSTGYAGSAQLEIVSQDLAGNNAPAQLQHLFEAEDSAPTPTADYPITHDPTTSRGTYLTYTGGLNNDPTTAPNILNYTFTVPVSGLYEMKFDALAPAGSNHALFAMISNAGYSASHGITRADRWVQFNNFTPSNNFTWNTLTNSESNDEAVLFYLYAGERTLSIAGQNNGITLDRVYVTNVIGSNPNTAPAPYLFDDDALPITINTSGNTAPTTTPDVYNLTEDTPLTINTVSGVLNNDNDPDNDSLTVILGSNPSHGTVTLNPDGSFTYIPQPNYNGTDTFTYIARDGHGGQTLETVTLNIAPDNDPPTGQNDNYLATEDQPLIIPAITGVLVNDSDPEADALTVASNTPPAHGVVTVNPDGSFTYTPANHYTGPDSFTYIVSDSHGGQSTVTVNLTVQGVNDTPTASDDPYSTNEDTPLTVNTLTGVLNNDHDLDGDTLTVNPTSLPSHGEITLNPNGSFTYTPQLDYNGLDSFTYQITDGHGGTANATVNLTVNPTSDPPHAQDDTYTVNEDATLTVVPSAGVLTNDNDPDGDTLTAHIISGPAHGTLTLNPNGGFVYIPHADFYGQDHFTYQTTDGSTPSNNAVARITVNPQPDAPTANDKTLPISLGGTVHAPATSGLLSIPTDIDGQTLVASILSGPSHGTLTLNADGSFHYQATAIPGQTLPLPDQFTYQLTDPDNQNAHATVYLIDPQIDENALAAALNIRTPPIITVGTPDVPFTLRITPTPSPAPRVAYLPPLTVENQTPPSGGPNPSWARTTGPAAAAMWKKLEHHHRRAGEERNIRPGIQAPRRALIAKGQIRFGQDNENALRLSDQNDSGETIRVTLEVRHGHITLATEKGISVEEALDIQDLDGDTTTARKITLTGSRSAIEKALDGLIYHTAQGPTDPTAQPDQLTITYDDQGHDGLMEALQNRRQVEILPVDPAPATPPSDLAEVDTQEGHLGASLLATGLASWFFRRRPQTKTTRTASQRGKRAA